jgi:hypothetical protein
MLPMLTFSIYAGWAAIHSQWEVVYNPATIGYTVACQALAAGEAAWILAHHGRSGLEASLALGFSLFVGIALVLTFAASNPRMDSHFNPVFYFCWVGTLILLTGSLAVIIAYHFSRGGLWYSGSAHALLMLVYLGVATLNMVVKPDGQWAYRNALQVGIHIACIIAWTCLFWKRGKQSLFKTV